MNSFPKLEFWSDDDVDKILAQYSGYAAILEGTEYIIEGTIYRLEEIEFFVETVNLAAAAGYEIKIKMDVNNLGIVTGTVNGFPMIKTTSVKVEQDSLKVAIIRLLNKAREENASN